MLIIIIIKKVGSARLRESDNKEEDIGIEQQLYGIVKG